MPRLPRAEDPVVLFIAVDGEPLRAEGVIQRVTLRAGVDMLHGTLAPVNGSGRVSGEISVQLYALEEASMPHEVDDFDLRQVGEVIVIREGGGDDAVSEGDGTADGAHDPLDT